MIKDIKGYEGLFNVHFTADMEGKLDKIANEGLDYLAVMKKFNDYLEKLVGQQEQVNHGCRSLESTAGGRFSSTSR